MQAVNMAGGLHWLHRPMPHNPRTRCSIRSCPPPVLACQLTDLLFFPFFCRSNQIVDIYLSSHDRCSPIQTDLGDAGVELGQEELGEHVMLYADYCKSAHRVSLRSAWPAKKRTIACFPCVCIPSLP